MDAAKALCRAEHNIRDGAAARTHRDPRRPPRVRPGGGRCRRADRKKRERIGEQQGTAETRRRLYRADARVLEKVRREEHALPRKALDFVLAPFRAHRSRFCVHQKSASHRIADAFVRLPPQHHFSCLWRFIPGSEAEAVMFLYSGGALRRLFSSVARLQYLSVYAFGLCCCGILCGAGGTHRPAGRNRWARARPRGAVLFPSCQSRSLGAIDRIECRWRLCLTNKTAFRQPLWWIEPG